MGSWPPSVARCSATRTSPRCTVATMAGPAFPRSLLATALLLHSYDRVSDDEANQRADCDLRWKVALGVDVEARPFAKSTLQEFRAQLVLHAQPGAVPAQPGADQALGELPITASQLITPMEGLADNAADAEQALAVVEHTERATGCTVRESLVTAPTGMG